VRDNTEIYHELVPESLPELQAVALAKVHDGGWRSSQDNTAVDFFVENFVPGLEMTNQYH
jgi:hypothetical protein